MKTVAICNNNCRSVQACDTPLSHFNLISVHFANFLQACGVAHIMQSKRNTLFSIFQNAISFEIASSIQRYRNTLYLRKFKYFNRYTTLADLTAGNCLCHLTFALPREQQSGPLDNTTALDKNSGENHAISVENQPHQKALSFLFPIDTGANPHCGRLVAQTHGSP